MSSCLCKNCLKQAINDHAALRALRPDPPHRHEGLEMTLHELRARAEGLYYSLLRYDNEVGKGFAHAHIADYYARVHDEADGEYYDRSEAIRHLRDR